MGSGVWGGGAWGRRCALARSALTDRRACLLGTHGMICFHDNLDKALWLGVELETLARQYWHARQAGEPVILSVAQMAEVLEKFKTYGKQPGHED